jgi:precorrin-6Y C5,15-methyltransferase (decarboxylating)
VFTRSAPEGLAGLPLPHAIFVGGGASEAGVLENCWQALTVGGRMVVHGVTLETEELLSGWHQRLGGELIRMSIERVEPLGSFRGWNPGRPITQWSMVKPARSDA